MEWQTAELCRLARQHGRPYNEEVQEGALPQVWNIHKGHTDISQHRLSSQTETTVEKTNKTPGLMILNYE